MTYHYTIGALEWGSWKTTFWNPVSNWQCRAPNRGTAFKLGSDRSRRLGHNPLEAPPPFATCPLPPEENRLAVGIEPGEKTYGHQRGDALT